MVAGKRPWLPITALLAAMVLWASSFIAMKMAFQVYDPMVIIWGRMAVATICFFFLRRRFRGIVYQPGDWKSIAFMVICEPCLYFIFEAGALTQTTASQAGIIVAMLPLLVAVAARFVLKEKITPRTMLGFVMAIGAAIWLSAGALSSELAPRPALGNLLEFLAMICATGYTITLKKLSLRYPPFFLTAMQALGGSIFFFPIMFLPPTHLPDRFEMMPILAIFYLGIFVTLAAYGFFNYGVSAIPASQASAFVNLIPVITIFLGWLVLGETFTFGQYLASLLVFAGVFMSQDPKAVE